MTMKVLGVSAIAEYTGNKPPAVHQWIQRHGPGAKTQTPLPEPVVSIVQKLATGPDDRITYGWAQDQLPQFREWYAKLKDWSPKTAEARWSEIDRQIRIRYGQEE